MDNKSIFNAVMGGTEPLFDRRGAPSGIAVSFAPSHLREPVRGGSQSVRQVAEWMGHANPTTTELVYTHLYAKGNHDDEMAALGG
jgi:integrase